MIVCDINLIAARRAQKQRALTVMRCAVYSLMVALVAVALLYARMWISSRLVQGRIAEVQARLTDPALADAVERLEFLEANIAQLEPRVALLQKVHDSEAAWIGILQDTGAAVPERVWVSQLASHRGQEGQTLSLRGSAFNQRDIGEFMLRLDKLSWSGAPALSYSQTNANTQGRPVVDYEITIPLQRPIGLSSTAASGGGGG